MPHPIYGPPSHTLDSIALFLTFGSKRNGFTTTLRAQGISETKRASLWQFTEAWQPDDHDNGLQPLDTLHWVARAVAEDRPTSDDQLRKVLSPPGWEEVPLF
uniref:Uncharacterized protein n=1 Tax=uncultured prokaryote TaxID=198431 RepID=A0A0H5PWG1_9ZZZZ|nr:hypothetical protein [uncultured prokaryote]